MNRGVSKRVATNAPPESQSTLVPPLVPASAPPSAASSGISGSTLEETKRLRTDRADQIRSLSLQEFLEQKGPLMGELRLLRGVESGWCHEAGGVLRTKDQHIYEVRSEGQHGKRAVAWTYVIGVIGAALHTVVCLLCFGEVFRSGLFNNITAAWCCAPALQFSMPNTGAFFRHVQQPAGARVQRSVKRSFGAFGF